jgi:hypothetical protein
LVGLKLCMNPNDTILKNNQWPISSCMYLD